MTSDVQTQAHGPERVAASLEQECRHLRQAQAVARVGSWTYQIPGRVLTVSDTLLDLYGLSRAAFSGGYDMLDARVHPDDRDAVLAATDRLMSGGKPMRMRYRVLVEGDGVRWVDARGVVDGRTDGAISRVAGTVADITELVDAETEAGRSHEDERAASAFGQAVIDATPDAIHIYDVASGRLRRASRTGRPLVGFTEQVRQVLAGEDIDTLVPAEDVALLSEALARAVSGLEVPRLRHRVADADSGVRWISRGLTPFTYAEDGAVEELLVVSRDVTDLVELEQRLNHAATHDDLTGLPNRRLLRETLDAAVAEDARHGHVAVLACDLDGFKRINDGYGHRVGDQVLAVVAGRLTSVSRDGDLVARMGGDEFAAILRIDEHEDPQLVASEVGRRLIERASEPITIDGVAHIVSLSVGIRIAQAGIGLHSAELLGDADAAMYHVKAHGANGYVHFEPPHRPDRSWRHHVERQLRAALATGTVEVLYQPIVVPATGQVHGVEALVRIRDANGEYLSTPEVIDVAEQTGLINELDAVVLDRACSQAARWRTQPGMDALVLKVNRSVQEITRTGFADRILDALDRSALPADALTLEITETVLLDAGEQDRDDLRRLHDHGVGLAIDDFGTGYASLRYLAELPITCIKIDRSFTGRLPGDSTSMTLVRATVGLAEQLEINCIVEGVETLEQLHALPSYERLLIQGYLFGRPQPAESISAVLAPTAAAAER